MENWETALIEILHYFLYTDTAFVWMGPIWRVCYYFLKLLVHSIFLRLRVFSTTIYDKWSDKITKRVTTPWGTTIYLIITTYIKTWAAFPESITQEKTEQDKNHCYPNNNWKRNIKLVNCHLLKDLRAKKI